MPTDEFENEVRRQAAREGIPDKMVKVAIDYFKDEAKERNKSLYGYNAKDCFIHVKRFWLASLSSLPEPDITEDPFLFLTPDVLIDSDLLVDAIKSEVERVRQELFSSSRPPFRSYEKAVEWLQKIEMEQHDRPKPKYFDIRKKMKELSDLLHCDIQPVRRTIPYAKQGPKGDWQLCDLPLFGDPSLISLEKASRKIAEATGFTQLTVVAHILAGLPPILPPVIIRSEKSTDFSLSGGEPIKRKTVTIELNTCSLTYEKFRTLFRTIQKELNPSKTKPANMKDKILFDIVKRLGGVPKSGQGAFWKMVQQEGDYKTPDAPRKRYARLMKKTGGRPLCETN